MVDYEVAARRYEGGRALAPGIVEAWRRAVDGLAPVRPGVRVLDLGAGTGLFSRAWAGWGAGLVAAVEPSAAMRAEAAARDPASVHHLAGRAEAVPLRDRAVDVAWLSTVLHHIGDLPAALGELRRVLVPGGPVHVRGYFPDRGRTTVLAFAPPAGAERARRRFPTAAAVTRPFADAGFAAVGAADVAEDHGATGVTAAAWVRRMRDADTLLGALTDDEVAATIAALAARGDEPLAPGVISVLTFRSPGA